MSWLDQVIGYGTHAARPAAGSAGRLYYETDTATLFRDSGTAWVALALGAGGAPGLVPLADVYLDTAPASTFDLTAIDQGYKALRIEALLRSTDPGVSIIPQMTFNADAGTNYDYSNAYNFAGVTGDAASLGQTFIALGDACAGGAPAGDFSPLEMWLPGYSNTHRNKAFRSYLALQGVYDSNHLGHEWVSGYWNSTTAITEITLAPAAGQWAQYSRVTLYGIV